MKTKYKKILRMRTHLALAISIALLSLVAHVEIVKAETEIVTVVPLTLPTSLQRNFQMMADRVRQITSDALELVIHGRSIHPFALLQQVHSGEIDLAIIGSSDIANILDGFSLNQPFLLNGIHQVTPLLQYAASQTNTDLNVRILSTWYLGSYVIAGKEIFPGPDSFTGKRILSRTDFSALGVQNVQLDYDARHDAISRSSIDAFETLILDPNLERHSGLHLTITNHRFWKFTAVMSPERLEQLTEQQRQGLLRALSEASDLYSSSIIEEENMRLEYLEGTQDFTVAGTDVPAFKSKYPISANLVRIMVGGNTGCGTGKCKCKTKTYGTKCQCKKECNDNNDCKSNK